MPVLGYDSACFDRFVVFLNWGSVNRAVQQLEYEIFWILEE